MTYAVRNRRRRGATSQKCQGIPALSVQGRRRHRHKPHEPTEGERSGVVGGQRSGSGDVQGEKGDLCDSSNG